MKNRMKIVVIIAILLLVGYVVSEHFNKKESNQEETTTVEEIKEEPKEETVVVEVKASVKESTKKEKNTKKLKKSPSKATKKATSKKKVVKKTQKVPSYNKSEIQNYARSMMSSYGWDDSEWGALVQIINHESGWKPNAVNKKSGACGLFQALPCKKMAKYGSDYRTNYKTQIKFGFAYIKNRYKTPTKAWAFWQKHHWY